MGWQSIKINAQPKPLSLEIPNLAQRFFMRFRGALRKDFSKFTPLGVGTGVQRLRGEIRLVRLLYSKLNRSTPIDK